MYIECSTSTSIRQPGANWAICFSEDLHPQAVHDAAVLTLAGFGLAKLAKNNGKIAWVGTEELAELQVSSSGPIDITPLMHASYNGGYQSIIMTGSLSVILKDIVAVGKCSGDMG